MQQRVIFDHLRKLHCFYTFFLHLYTFYLKHYGKRIMNLKIGDLVTPISGFEFPQELQVGIIIEVIDHNEVPPVCKIWWSPGVIDKDWSDELCRITKDA